MYSEQKSEISCGSGFEIEIEQELSRSEKLLHQRGRYLSLSSNRGLGLTSCYLSINTEADSRLDQLGYPTNEAIKKSIFLYCNYTKKVFGVLGDIFRY